MQIRSMSIPAATAIAPGPALHRVVNPSNRPRGQLQRDDQWSAQELQLLQGMLQTQLKQSNRSAAMGNVELANQQSARDLERVAVLKKAIAALPHAITLDAADMVGVCPATATTCPDACTTHALHP